MSHDYCTTMWSGYGSDCIDVSIHWAEGVGDFRVPPPPHDPSHSMYLDIENLMLQFMR